MLDETVYTQVSWALLRIRLQDAREACNYTSQEYIDIAEQKLRTAMNALVKIDGIAGGSGDNSEGGGSNEGGSDGEGSGDIDVPLTAYLDGTYEAAVLCIPDEDEDFESYNLSLKITVQNDKIVSVTDIRGDGDSSNDTYINRAANGTSSRIGVVAQIINKGVPEEIDTVSRATCSSKSIIEACEKALQSALRQ